MRVHLDLCSRLPATLTLPSSSFHAQIRNQGGHYGSTTHAFCSSSSALQPHVLNRAMSLPLPCSRISPSYQPGKWKVGIRRFGRQESCWHRRTCTHRAVQFRAGGVAAWKFPSVVLAAGCSGAALLARGLVAAVSGLGRGELWGSQLDVGSDLWRSGELCRLCS